MSHPHAILTVLCMETKKMTCHLIEPQHSRLKGPHACGRAWRLRARRGHARGGGLGGRGAGPPPTREPTPAALHRLHLVRVSERAAALRGGEP